MANPNIAGLSNIYGKVAGQAVTTSATAIVTNSNSSGKIYKITSLIISNVDGTNNAEITATVYKNQSTEYHLAKSISVPAKATLVVISKDTTIYLEENDSIRLTASANSDLEAVCAWEEVS
tara:strand:- start:3740 stop:4102 length:363 start_codon:yes stop_codon:yes gene_type:complete